MSKELLALPLHLLRVSTGGAATSTYYACGCHACRPEFLREVEKREEEEEVVESIEIREDRTLTKQLRQVRCAPACCGCWWCGAACLLS